jgi:D-amino-acid dehydrogenase
LILKIHLDQELAQSLIARKLPNGRALLQAALRAASARFCTESTTTPFPEVSTGRVIPWAGLRPMLPSMLPRVGRGKRPGVFYNTGHGHLGWTLSAATAELLAQAVEK